MSEEATVTYELDGEIALVGLNRPDKRNCFNPTVMGQLRAAIERAGEEAKCGIIFGHGDNFCAGLDLRWAAENWKTGRSERLPFPFNRNTYFEAMARGNIPFIAALHGATLGGGLETAAAAHIRVADDTRSLCRAGKRSLHVCGAPAVDVGRVDEVDPDIEGLAHALLRLLSGDPTRVGEPRAQADLGDVDVT